MTNTIRIHNRQHDKQEQGPTQRYVSRVQVQPGTLTLSPSLTLPCPCPSTHFFFSTCPRPPSPPPHLHRAATLAHRPITPPTCIVLLYWHTGPSLLTNSSARTTTSQLGERRVSSSCCR